MDNSRSKDILQVIDNYHTISIIGMCKNVGKTTVLNYLLKKARGNTPFGLTSIGRDGETVDMVTATEKPLIYVKKGTIIATAKKSLFNSDITREILKTTGISTAMGEVVVARALSDGNVELAGPDTISNMVDICNYLSSYGSEKILIDGALSRKATATPRVSEGVILATGAALNKDINIVVKDTVHAIELLTIKKEENEKLIGLAEKISLRNKLGIVYKGYNVKCIDTDMAIISVKHIINQLRFRPKAIVIKGVVSNGFLKEIVNSGENLEGTKFIVEDGTKLFVEKGVLDKFHRQGGKITCIKNINILCVTCNPKSPFGYEFNKEELVKKLEADLNLPVFNVKGSENY